MDFVAIKKLTPPRSLASAKSEPSTLLFIDAPSSSKVFDVIRPAAISGESLIRYITTIQCVVMLRNDSWKQVFLSLLLENEY